MIAQRFRFPLSWPGHTVGYGLSGEVPPKYQIGRLIDYPNVENTCSV